MANAEPLAECSNRQMFLKKAIETANFLSPCLYAIISSLVQAGRSVKIVFI
ncbi:hypothetical protein RvY_19046 [Ramazzottius varieornatus]|uniref:Uncharacterized protein n=1 Tax=Ramazzottius varieornatus TaxID=947166 RepID=A0A1D1WBG7_RAMVA|nr:hypothetical protein RvY_19046 [Ramazzottius varieornatus]